MTTEFLVDEMARTFDLNPNRFCLLGALLGNHILPPKDLEDFHRKLAPPDPATDSKNKVRRDAKVLNHRNQKSI
jgi:hypothetical protein